jgi:hypothetical protein
MPASLPVAGYAEMWADEILPIAQQAYARLELRNVKPLLDGERTVAAGQAIEKPAADHVLYRAWSTNVVRDELHKAGWRLADLLERVL